MATESPVLEFRLAVLAEDYDAALRFYRDVLGLPENYAFETAEGRGVILAAGKATLELLSKGQVDFVDEVEVGRAGVSPPIRLALEVADSEATAAKLTQAGATHVGGPTTTPWRHRNIRLNAPAGLQLTLFTVLKD